MRIRFIYPLVLILLASGSCRRKSTEVVIPEKVTWDENTDSFMKRFKIKTIINESRKYSDDGTLLRYQAFYADGSKAEIGFAIWDEKYKDAKAYEVYEDNKVSQSDALKGICIQYFPDNPYVTEYNGRFPPMVIHVYNNGKRFGFGFTPDGERKDGGWCEDKGDILLFHDIEDE